jgi:hypothetical protein
LLLWACSQINSRTLAFCKLFTTHLLSHFSGIFTSPSSGALCRFLLRAIGMHLEMLQAPSHTQWRVFQ